MQVVLVRKIAFISPVPIRLPKEAEDEISLRDENTYAVYRHPVLYLIRTTKRDKDYIYVYCGKTTYVLMKVKTAHIEYFISILRKLLENYVKTEDLDAFEAEIRLYCSLSALIQEIYNETLKLSLESYKNYLPLLLSFDPILRRKLRKPLAAKIVKIVLNDVIRKKYSSLSNDTKGKLSLENFRRIILSEISTKGIIENILRQTS